MQGLLEKILSNQSLTEDEMISLMRAVSEGKLSDSLLSAFLVALRMKGESVEEITGAARVLREKSIPVVSPEGFVLVDTCGTGGDGANTFNISTAAAFVAAGAGVAVAKHGNRAVSSLSGSADVLGSLGVNIDLDSEGAKRCLAEAGIAFLFAPRFHPAMKHVAHVRKDLKIRTLFNLLGPLCNPAKVRRQVIGVFSEDWLKPIALSLDALGSERAFIVHADDGLDEVSLVSNTSVVELKAGEITHFEIDPTELGFEYCSPRDLEGQGADANACIVRDILDGSKGPRREIVLLNAALAIAVSDDTLDIKESLERAKFSIRSGAARQKLKDLCRVSQALSS